MKKFWLIALAALTFALSACGGISNGNSYTSDSSMGGSSSSVGGDSSVGGGDSSVGGGGDSSSGDKENDCVHIDNNDDEVCDSCKKSVVVTVDFFAINDLHGKFDDTYDNIGVDEMSTYLKNARTENANTVILSSGDMWQGSAESNFTKGKVITEWMNEMDFAAMTLGNHEFDWGTSYIESNAELAQFPLLAINVFDVETDKRVEYCDASVMLELDGVKIGLIGAIGDCYSDIAAGQADDVYFKVGNELTALVKAESERLRADGADMIVYSIHDARQSNGSYYNSSLSNGYVDLVFEGHSHTYVREQDSYGVWHLQAYGDNSEGISHATVKVNTVKDEVVTDTAEIVYHASYESLTDDPIVDEVLERYADELVKVNEVLGENDSYRDSDDLANFAAEAMYFAGEKRWGEDPKYAGKIVLGGGFLNVRSPYYLPKKTVTYGDLYPLFTFDNPIVLCKVTGARLTRQFLETTNSRYYMYYGEYGEWVKENVVASETYYVVVDTYCANFNFSGMGFMEIVEYYDEAHSVFVRDILADFVKDGGMSSLPPVGTAYTDIADIHAKTSPIENIAARGEVIAVSKQSFLFADGTGIMMYYTGSVPSVVVGDEVEIRGTTSIYNNNQQFAEKNPASYAVKDVDVPKYQAPTPVVWGNAEVEAYNGVIGGLVKVTGDAYTTGSYVNMSKLAANSTRIVSLINPSNEVLGNIVLSSTPQTVEITGYPCYINAGKYLNILVTSMRLVEDTSGTPRTLSLTTEFGGSNIDEYATGTYGSDFVNGVTVEYYRAYAPSTADYIACLVPFIEGSLPASLYNTTPTYGISSMEITYKSESGATLYTGDDRVGTMTAYSLPASTNYATKTVTVDKDNFFKIDGGEEPLYIKAFSVSYDNKAVTYTTVKKGSAVNARLNATRYRGGLNAGASTVSAPVSVVYDGGSCTVLQTKEYTYYTLAYVKEHLSQIAKATITSPVDVANYYLAFGEFPANYATKNFGGNDFDTVAEVFGADTRYVSQYDRTSGYAQYVPYNHLDTTYYEFDIALDESYNESNRGVGRVVIWRAGWLGEGYDDSPVAVYTDDHYATFQEYLNTGAFGTRFDAERNITFTEWSATKTYTES